MNIIMTVFKKELTDMFRDKKTVIMSILVPLLIFPILFGFMGSSLNNDTKNVQDNIKIAIIDEGNSELYNFLTSIDGVNIVESQNIDEDVKNGEVLLGLTIPSNFDQSIVSETSTQLQITYDNVSTKSSTAMRIISSYINDYSNTIISKRLEARNINPEILNPIIITERTSVKENESFGKLMLGMLLPLLLMMYSATGPLAAATDLGAGEKERGTLEPLLTTQASRMSLLWGKFLAITVMGALTALASVTGVFIAMQQENGIFEGALNGSNFGIGMLVLIGLLTLLTTMVFGAIELAISIYARSFKEAQTYLTPITIIAMVSAFSTYMLDAKSLSIQYFFIPFVNITALIKELATGIFNYTHIGITLVWVIIYVVIAISFARYMFSKEDVIFRT